MKETSIWREITYYVWNALLQAKISSYFILGVLLAGWSKGFAWKLKSKVVGLFPSHLAGNFYQFLQINQQGTLSQGYIICSDIYKQDNLE